MNYYQANTTNLAYMGDAVYEVFIRKMLIDASSSNTNILHRRAVKYVSANGQAKAIRAMFEELSEKEQALVKRARNHKSATKPKNADPVVYKWATAFEALVGYLYLDGQEERMKEVIEKAIAIINGE